MANPLIALNLPVDTAPVGLNDRPKKASLGPDLLCRDLRRVRDVTLLHQHNRVGGVDAGGRNLGHLLAVITTQTGRTHIFTNLVIHDTTMAPEVLITGRA